MAYNDNWLAVLEIDGRTHRRAKSICLKLSNDIWNEDVGTPNHVNRKTWADLIFGITGTDAIGFTSTSSMKMLRFGIPSNTTFQTDGENISDSDLEFVLNSIIQDAAKLAAISQ